MVWVSIFLTILLGWFHYKERQRQGKIWGHLPQQNWVESPVLMPKARATLRGQLWAMLTLPPTHSLRGVANAFGTRANSLRGVAIVGGFLRSP